MLVLSRRFGERITIGPDIEIVVVEIDRGRVRLGISAPRSVAIGRPESETYKRRTAEPTAPDEPGFSDGIATGP